MSIPSGTAYYYLNSQNQLVMKVQWVDAPTDIVYLKPDGTEAPDGSYALADDAVSFTLYADGSLESYRNLGGDGSFTWLKFAQATPGHSLPFGPNSEYTHGDLIFSETLSPDLVHETKSFADGNLVTYEFCYGSPENSSVVLTGNYDAQTGASTVSLSNLAHATPITISGTGYINSLNGLSAQLIGNDGSTLIGNDGSTLVGNDGASLIGNDGSTLVQTNVLSLIGNDGSTLVGNDGGTLINFAGTGNSIISSAYEFNGGRLIGNDGSTLVGTDGATLAANAMASFRGFSAYSLTSFEGDSDPTIDTVAGDLTTTAEVDLYGNFSGDLETAGDRDWIKVDLKAGETYVISADGADTDRGSLGNPVVRLYDANGTLVAENDNGGVGANARMTITAQFDGPYYVEAASSGDTGVGSYQIGVHQQATAFVKGGVTIDNITGAGAFSETSIAALSDGGYAIGFTARIDGHQDFPFNQSYHAHVEIIDANGHVVDEDPRADYSTFSIYRGGDYNNVPGQTQVTAGADGGYTVIVPNVYPIETGMIYRSVIAQGTENGLSPIYPLTPDSSPTFRTYSTYGSDITRLSNGQYIASMGSDGVQGTDQTGDMIQVSINGALPITIDTATGINVNGQRTSISALGDGAVVVYSDANADAGSQSDGVGVVGAIVSANGTVLHTFKVNETVVRAQFVDSSQAVAELADGGFVVTWSGKEDDPNYADPYTDCYFRVFNADGTPRTAEMVLGDNQSTGQGRPCVIGLPAGGFVIAWSDMGSLRLQQFDDMGAEIGVETGIGFGGGHSLAIAPDGKLAVSYAGGGGLHVQIMEPNHGPTDITLSGNTIDENAADYASIVIGNVAAVDQNASDTFTYELLDSANGTFRLDGTAIRWNDVGHAPDFEAQSSYTIQVKVTDSADVSVTKSLTINVADVNEPVIGLKGDAFATVSEDSETGLVLATLVGDDPDQNETFTYAIVDGADEPFAIVGNELKLTGPVDFEASQTHVLKLLITDSANHSVEKDFTVHVADVDDTAPNQLALGVDHVEENAAAGTAIASISASDPDTFTGLAYELVGPNAELFEIKEQFGSMWLFTKAVLDHETMPTVDVTIRVTDPGNRSLEKTFTLDVDDMNDLPVITSEDEFTVEEGTNRIVKLAATDADGDAITWTVEATDTSDTDFIDFFAFSVDSEGYVVLDPGVEADNPWDADKDGVYHFAVRAHDGTDDAYQEMTVTVVGGNTDPIIDGGLNTLVTIKENQTLVKTIVATDADSDPLTYSIVGGPDSDLFSIANTGGKAQLVYKAGPDFENPHDIGNNNSYNVIIRADDGQGGVYDQAVAVEVKNVGGITFKGTPKADTRSGTGEEDRLSGAAQNDKLDGKGGNDILNGGLGKDTLTGGTGHDVFVFDTALSKKNVDKIVKFSVEDDVIDLATAVFKKTGQVGATLDNDAFAINSAGKATDKFDRIIYDDDSGKLFFDMDGSGKKNGTVLFAMLDKHLELTSDDFMLV